MIAYAPLAGQTCRGQHIAKDLDPDVADLTFDFSDLDIWDN